jgi:hypothetical protein
MEVRLEQACATEAKTNAKVTIDAAMMESLLNIFYFAG